MFSTFLSQTATCNIVTTVEGHSGHMDKPEVKPRKSNLYVVVEESTIEGRPLIMIYTASSIQIIHLGQMKIVQILLY